MTKQPSKRELARKEKELRKSVQAVLEKVREQESATVYKLDSWRMTINGLRELLGLGNQPFGHDAYQG